MACESVFTRTWQSVICVQRRLHIFSYVSFHLTSTPVVDVLLAPETLRWRRPSSCIKSCQGTVFSLSTVVKNHCERCRGARFKATSRSSFFCLENLNTDRYYSLMFFSLSLCSIRLMSFYLSLLPLLITFLRIVIEPKIDLSFVSIKILEENIRKLEVSLENYYQTR